MTGLRQLMTAYLHQDWREEYDGARTSAVDDFARRESDRVLGTLDDIDELLRSARSDAAVAHTLDALGNFRDPGDSPGAHASRLVAVRPRLNQAADGPATRA